MVEGQVINMEDPVSEPAATTPANPLSGHSRPSTGMEEAICLLHSMELLGENRVITLHIELCLEQHITALAPSRLSPRDRAMFHDMLEMLHSRMGALKIKTRAFIATPLVQTLQPPHGLTFARITAKSASQMPSPLA